MSSIKKLAKILPEIDHRLIGERQKLFFFSEFSKGSCFFQPRGTHIYNKLVSYLRDEYNRRHYEEVITPNIYDCRLWQTSGHWEHYEEHMIKFKLGEHDFSLKPMNCPGHCLMFKNLGPITSEQLPIRLADFGVLHRNEFSGALMGLSRVRRFQQDDAHIFCTPEQVELEVRNCLEFADHIYKQFDFTYSIALSLRPKKYLGKAELWDQAEESLRQALRKSNFAYEEQSFEGAFYGPKIDLIIKDSKQRSQQCATIQLDFQLPQRFELAYKICNKLKQTTEANQETTGLKRPVLIHRAILGSLERFIAMLAEHTAGRWPFWLSPLQALVIPVSRECNDYALSVKRRLQAEGFMADCELNPGMTLRSKIAQAHALKYNFILIAGNKEAECESVTARVTVEKKAHQICVSVERLVELFKGFQEKRVKHVDKELLAKLAN